MFGAGGANCKLRRTLCERETTRLMSSLFTALHPCRPLSPIFVRWYSSLWRVKAGFHTLPQVLVGAVVGALDAALWYYFARVYFTQQVCVVCELLLRAKGKGGTEYGDVNLADPCNVAPKFQFSMTFQFSTPTVTGYHVTNHDLALVLVLVPDVFYALRCSSLASACSHACIHTPNPWAWLSDMCL